MTTTIHRTNVVNPSHCTVCKNYFKATKNTDALAIHLRYTTKEERYHLVANNRTTEENINVHLEHGNQIFGHA